VEKVSEIVIRLAVGGFALVGLTTLVALAITPRIVVALVGPAYIPAILPTQIILCALPFNSVTGVLVSGLGAIDRAKDGTKIVAVTLLVAVASHLLLDPSAGAVGGGIATALRDPAGLMVAGVLSRRAGLLRASRTTFPYWRRRFAILRTDPDSSPKPVND
jgi:O-antigen/teichoic acid export membrane protein